MRNNIVGISKTESEILNTVSKPELNSILNSFGPVGKNKYSKLDLAIEWIKCKSNPLYFIYNYCHISEVGRKRAVTPEMVHPKMRRTVRCLYRYHNAILMASRQLGKSTFASWMLTWCITFFPGLKAAIFNFKRDTALENLEKVKFNYFCMPDWMRIGQPSAKNRALKTYFELLTGSKISLHYPATIFDPSTLARSLTLPVLYVDECAFISHMDEIYTSAQPTISTARTQAIRNKYPYFMFISSTPNGVEGDGEFFHELWKNCIDSDEIFKTDPETGLEDWVENADEIYNGDDTRNSFVGIKYHWSEHPDRDDVWYKDQCRQLNHNMRQINQELNLKFVGSSSCIFDDETIEQFESVPAVYNKIFSEGCKMSFFVDPEEIDKTDYYLIGVDTASGSSGLAAYNAIEVYSYRDFVQVAEANFKLGHLLKYGEIIDAIFRYFRSLVGDRIILCIENNSIGKAPIEYLLDFVTDLNYTKFIYKEKNKNDFGINTNGQTKELMTSLSYDFIKENPKRIKSQRLISQLSTIERNSRGQIRGQHFSDMFMATSFTAYVKKQTSLDILPKLDFTSKQYEKKTKNEITLLMNMNNVKGNNPLKQNVDQGKLNQYLNGENDDISSIYNSFISNNTRNTQDVGFFDFVKDVDIDNDKNDFGFFGF